MNRLAKVAIGGGVLIVLAVAGLILERQLGHSNPKALQVRVNGRSVDLASGITLGRAAALLGLHPRAGNLLDVEGAVLRRDALPGRLLLDGGAVAATTRLREGDWITVVNGHNQREPLSRQMISTHRGIPADPQFTLSRSPGREFVIRGALSHKLVAVRFERHPGRTESERAVALTFDDGPSPQYTARILAILRRLHVRATFFVIGYLADEYPALVRQELRAGMTVGNHSYNHPEVPPFDQLPTQLAADEISLGGQSLRRAGATPMLFRPPGGSFSTQLTQTAEKLGERIVLWSVDPRDWQPNTSPGQIVRGVLTAVRPGSIIDLHDGGGDRTATLTALPTIIKGIRKRHLRLVALTPH
jgi:peptidoglycan/xylan/chitin deacetylase (PgdA/CDA1 family)